jgi:hypothetical protein
MTRISAVLTALLLGAAALAHAQELRGTVRDSASARPISGAVIQILGAAGQTVASSLTNQRGE